MTDVIDRFLRYVKIDTQSEENSTTYPSTTKQLDLARVLVEELTALGMQEVKIDSWGYVTATLPANTSEPRPVVGLLAHMDTSFSASGKDVKPRIVENYDGGDILLNATHKVVLSPTDFPELRAYQGEDLIVTDGTTLLGADDKAGIAEIMSAMAWLIAHPEVKHGKVRVGFTPDEEVGAGVDHFDVPAFGADFAYTLDGGPIGELQFENFNAASAAINVHGRSVHPGTAKGTMKNAATIAMEFHALLPTFDRPEFTEKYEGFFHLVGIQGHAEEATLRYIIRDHDHGKFEQRKIVMEDAAEFLNKRYGVGTVEVAIIDSYYNMLKMVEPHPEIIEFAKAAYQAVGIEPRVIPIRGGTDGARLSYMGLPTPNMFTGGHNAHGRFEYIPVKSLEKAVEMIVKLVELIGQ
ncbi:MAG: peptidase T [Anaerolineaceae bacterium]